MLKIGTDVGNSLRRQQHLALGWAGVIRWWGIKEKSRKVKRELVEFRVRVGLFTKIPEATMPPSCCQSLCLLWLRSYRNTGAGLNGVLMYTGRVIDAREPKFSQAIWQKCTVSLKQILISRPKGRFCCFKTERDKYEPRRKNGREIMGTCCRKPEVASAVRLLRGPALERNGAVGCLLYVPCCSHVCITVIMC